MRTDAVMLQVLSPGELVATCGGTETVPDAIGDGDIAYWMQKFWAGVFHAFATAPASSYAYGKVGYT